MSVRPSSQGLPGSSGSGPARPRSVFFRLQRRQCDGVDDILDGRAARQVVDWSVEVIGVVLKSLGYDYNETDPVKVAEAREKLFAFKPNIMRFETNTPEDSLVNGEAVAGFMYSNQAVKGVQARADLAPVFPTEGVPIFIDSWVMSKEAPNKEGAYQFLNFIMRPEVAARIADLTKFTSPNKAAEEFLPEDFKNNPMLNLADEVLENASFYIGVDRVLDEYEHIYLEFKLR